MRLSLIVAVAENGVIGRDNDLPWRLSGDLQHFKSLTMGKPIIMGRKTYESIGRPLPGRTNIVMTRDPQFSADGIEVVNSLDNAMAMGEQAAKIAQVDELVVIGGANVYAAALPEADRLYITEVHMTVDGDVKFPEINQDGWTEVSREFKCAAPEETCDYSFVVYDRSVT
ncbi:MAG: dihydrofolate reductase [Rhodospirillaceae bacterium]|nr:dihydrofolate reductase [Rhodospirillaceae bacterium]|tara:strand:- start:37974 stop:38483 length:510 start_codon:yes stop_codon:yes gene_type:complete